MSKNNALSSRLGTSLLDTEPLLVVFQVEKPSFNWCGRGCFIIYIINTSKISSDTCTAFVMQSHPKAPVERAALTQPHLLLFGSTLLTPGQAHWPKPLNTYLRT